MNNYINLASSSSSAVHPELFDHENEVQLNQEQKQAEHHNEHDETSPSLICSRVISRQSHQHCNDLDNDSDYEASIADHADQEVTLARVSVVLRVNHKDESQKADEVSCQPSKTQKSERINNDHCEERVEHKLEEANELYSWFHSNADAASINIEIAHILNLYFNIQEFQVFS